VKHKPSIAGVYTTVGAVMSAAAMAWTASGLVQLAGVHRPDGYAASLIFDGAWVAFAYAEHAARHRLDARNWLLTVSWLFAAVSSAVNLLAGLQLGHTAAMVVVGAIVAPVGKAFLFLRNFLMEESEDAREAHIGAVQEWRDRHIAQGITARAEEITHKRVRDREDAGAERVRTDRQARVANAKSVGSLPAAPPVEWIPSGGAEYALAALDRLHPRPRATASDSAILAVAGAVGVDVTDDGHGPLCARPAEAVRKSSGSPVERPDAPAVPPVRKPNMSDAELIEAGREVYRTLGHPRTAYAFWKAMRDAGHTGGKDRMEAAFNAIRAEYADITIQDVADTLAGGES